MIVGWFNGRNRKRFHQRSSTESTGNSGRKDARIVSSGAERVNQEKQRSPHLE